MKSAARVGLLLVLVLFAGVPLLAQDRNIQFTVFVGQADMQGENEFAGGLETDFEEGSAMGLSANWFVNPHFSVEGAVFALRSDAALALDEATAIDLGKLNLTVFTAGAQFHVLGQRRIDPYIGGGGAYVISDDFFTSELEAGGVGRIELASEVAYYVNAGLGVQITPGFGLVLDARYIPYETSSRSTATGVEQELEISPRIYSAGVRLRF